MVPDQALDEEPRHEVHRINAIVRFAFGALDRAIGTAQPEPVINKNEIAGYGPQWACEDFGKTDHDYYSCPVCNSNYKLWIVWLGGIPPMRCMSFDAFKSCQNK